MSYGPNYPTCSGAPLILWTRYLRGAKPSDFPVEQPTKFDFAINLTTS